MRPYRAMRVPILLLLVGATGVFLWIAGRDSLLILLRPNRFMEKAIEQDYEAELTKNKQLAAAGEQRQAEYRAKLERTIKERVDRWRARFFGALRSATLTILPALLIGVVLRRYYPYTGSWTAVLSRVVSSWSPSSHCLGDNPSPATRSSRSWTKAPTADSPVRRPSYLLLYSHGQHRLRLLGP